MSTPGNQLCLDDAGGSTDNGANVRIWTCNDPQRPAGAQNWKLKDEGNGYFALLNQYSGGCLDYKLGEKTPDPHAQQLTCSDFVTQNWKFDPLGNGYYMVG